MTSARLFVVSFALVLAGCGGDGADPAAQAGAGSTNAAPTRQAFIAQADAICERAYVRFAEIEQRVQQSNEKAASFETSLEAAAPLLAEAAEAQREHVSGLRELTPPSGDERTVDKVLTSVEEQAGRLDRIADAAEDGDIERYRQVMAEADEGRTRGRGLMQGYGFRECGSGGEQAE